MPRSSWAAVLFGMALWALSACVTPAPAIGPGFPEHGVDGVTVELDEACTQRGLPVCMQAAARYRNNADAYAKRRRAVVLYRGCMMSIAGACSELASAIEGDPSALAPDSGRLRAAASHMCGSAYPARPEVCLAAAFRARACDQGDAAACGSLAQAVESGALGRRDGARARMLRSLACDRGHADSCVDVALTLVLGAHGLPADPARAAALLRRSCDAGDARACRLLGHLHRRGIGMPIDAEKARALYKEGCERSDAQSCFALATMLERGLGGQTDMTASLATLRRACEMQSGEACVALARRVEHGRGVVADPARAYDVYRSAARLFEAGCERGDSQACGGLGQLLREGSGVAEDRSRGVTLEKRACESGDAPACLRWMTRGGHFTGGSAASVGAMIIGCRMGAGDACFVVGRIGPAAARLYGFVDPRDAFARGCALGHAPSCNAAGAAHFPPDDAARAQLERACKMGDAAGCHHLALALEFPSVQQNPDLASEAHRNACRWGLARACARLADIRISGETEPPDADGAQGLYDRACSLGDQRGCLELGALLLAGTRVARDAERGHRLLSQSCERGEAAACTHLGVATLRGDGVARDVDAGIVLLARACEGGDARGCVALSEATRKKSDDAAALGHLRSTVAASAGACRHAIDVCHRGEDARVIATWSSEGVEDAGQALLLSGVPSCDSRLERRCNEAADAAVELCGRDGEGCAPAAELLRDQSSVGLAGSKARREELEKKAFAHARAGCKKRDAAACAREADAHERGLGTARDEKAAQRARETACSIDPSLCR